MFIFWWEKQFGKSYTVNFISSKQGCLLFDTNYSYFDLGAKCYICWNIALTAHT